ncbi:MAG: MraY family glycosyltransferase [Prevotella sp.]
MGSISFKLFNLAILLPLISSMLLVFWIHPLIVKTALLKDIVDNPDARKLQKEPVPVLGGFAVYWGIVIGAGITSIVFHSYALLPSIVALTVMVYIGTLDDIQGLSPTLRLVIEVLVVAFVVYMDQSSMNHFHGLFGIEKLPVFISVPLCIVGSVGIINAINMIDGVDGLSSGFCILACFSFGILFIAAYSGTMIVMAMLGIGSLIPFLFHNVFGKKTKMFIGDSGTLMMGMLMAIFCMRILDNTSIVAQRFPNIGVVAFCLSVLSVPVFDTLRVMVSRMLRGNSPFHPDKSHLHHLFVEIGFSHIGTSFMVLSLNCINILAWLTTYLLGGSVTLQFIVVVMIGFMNTTGFFYVVRRLDHSKRSYRYLAYLAKLTHVEVGKFYYKMREFVDRI